MTHDFQGDIDAVQNIDAVSTILDVVCRATGMGFAAVARVTEERWIVCQMLDTIDFGLPAGAELKIETTICHEIREHRQVVAIDDVSKDLVYANHPTPALYGLQSYISMPIVLPDGRFFGTLCAVDPKPARLNNPQILGMFKLFAHMIAYHLDANEKLIDARAVSELREQFIAILGHDLRNPLAAIDGGTNILMREVQSDKSVKVIALMRSSVQRMSGLIDNVLDFARGRLGGGLTVELSSDVPLETVLAQVVSEIRSGHPERHIEMDIQVNGPVAVDQGRLAQMFSNLLGNAIGHGDPDTPIRVQVHDSEGIFALSVANQGPAIGAATMKKLFRPFSRGDDATGVSGLGLGLYISSQIAKAHGGTLDVVSDDSETRFTFRMPRGKGAAP